MSEQTTIQDVGPSNPIGHGSGPTPKTPPPPPNPATDAGLVAQAQTPRPPTFSPIEAGKDLFEVAPIAALKLLSSGIEALVRITGDIPPTPPPTSPHIPHMRGMVEEKAQILRSHSERDLARLAQQEPGTSHAPAATTSTSSSSSTKSFPQTPTSQEIDGVHLRQTATPTPPPPPATPEPYVVIGANSQPLNLQHSAITRKFYSKAPPPISIEDYLLRIHRFCPMSTAVYLATSLYIYRLAVDERAIPVTRRNCHRLLLAGLRVAMKALEDLSYPHAKIARVGGVSPLELARLEISFCFLAGFELVAREEVLRTHWEQLRDGRMAPAAAAGMAGGFEGGKNMVLRLEHRRKKKAEEEAVVG